MLLTLTVPDMACSACVATISTAITTLDATATVTADPATKQVQIETQASEVEVRQAIQTAGYHPTP